MSASYTGRKPAGSVKTAKPNYISLHQNDISAISILKYCVFDQILENCLNPFETGTGTGTEIPSSR